MCLMVWATKLPKYYGIEKRYSGAIVFMCKIKNGTCTYTSSILLLLTKAGLFQSKSFFYFI